MVFNGLVIGVVVFVLLYLLLEVECSKLMDFKNLLIDIGVDDKVDVEKIGIKLG